MSASRSATTVTIVADFNTCFACCAVSTQRTDSRSASGRCPCDTGFTPTRLQTSPPTRPRHDPAIASTATIACTSTPYALPFLTGPRPRRRCAVVGNFTSDVSWIASTCRPAQAAPVRSAQPATSCAAVTFRLAKNRPARNSPLRLPPSRRKHTVLRATICSRIAPPFYRGADLRTSQATIPWRLLCSVSRRIPNRTRAASRKRRSLRRSGCNITCVHALAPSRGQAMGWKPAARGGLQLRAWPGTYPRQRAARRLPRHPAVRWLRGLQEIRRRQIDRGLRTLAFCWSHVRRGFYDLAKAKAPIATETLQRIAALYEIEARVRGNSAADRQAVRHVESRPLVTELRIWFEAQIAKLPARGPTADAIRYALNHWDGLEGFLEDGRIELDNNSVERAMRPVCLSRKNSLFAGSDEGGANWACLASLIETCKLNNVNPQGYFTDLLTRLVNGWPQKRIDELMPWFWGLPAQPP